MKKIISTTVLAAFISIGIFSQNHEILHEKSISKFDVSGKWVGKRHQYTSDHKGILQTFEYEFNLTQEGNIVTGTSSIYGTNGDYGDMKLRGVIVGNKLMFEEYEILSENHSNPLRTWCFKAGELCFAKDGNKVKLIGATSSHIPYYNVPCSGGYTHLEKIDDGAQAIDLSKNLSSKFNEDNFVFTALPNPFTDKTKIALTIQDDSQVELTVLDMSGKTVSELYSGKLPKGQHEFIFDAQKNQISATNYIVVVKLHGETHSRLLSRIH
jgi:hypothetical protein